MAAIFFQVKIFELRLDGEGWAGGFFCSEFFGVEDFVGLLSMKKLARDFFSEIFLRIFLRKLFSWVSVILYLYI